MVSEDGTGIAKKLDLELDKSEIDLKSSEIFEETIKDFKKYVELHNMHELLSNLLTACFEENSDNPKRFIVDFLIKSMDEPTEDEKLMNQLDLQIEKLSDVSSVLMTGIKTQICRLEQKSSAQHGRISSGSVKFRMNRKTSQDGSFVTTHSKKKRGRPKMEAPRK